MLSEDPKVGDVMVASSCRPRFLAMNGATASARKSPSFGPRRLPCAARAKSSRFFRTTRHQSVVGAFRRMGNLPVLVPEDDSAMVVHLIDLQSFVPHVGRYRHGAHPHRGLTAQRRRDRSFDRKSLDPATLPASTCKA